MRPRAGVTLICALTLAGCASTTTTGRPPVAVAGPQTTTVTATPSTTLPAATATPSVAASATPVSPATGLTGSWNGTYQSAKYPNTHGTFQVTFSQTGQDITGQVHIDSDCVGNGTITGTVTNSRISFGVVKAAETITFDGTILASGLRGTYHSGTGCGDDNGSWMAMRG